MRAVQYDYNIRYEESNGSRECNVNDTTGKADIGEGSNPGASVVDTNALAKQCPICLDDIEAESCTTRCGHPFHTSCLHTWSTSKQHIPTVKQWLKTASQSGHGEHSFDHVQVLDVNTIRFL